MTEKNCSERDNQNPRIPHARIVKILAAAALFSLVLATSAFAADQYKPFLHEASVPESPKVKLYGSYATNLFPGAATYDYPIELPAGTAGLAPGVSLSYNSQTVGQRPEVLGAGWSLSRDYVARDVNSTPDDASDDSFKLVLGGTAYDLVYVAADGYYHTKVESFVRVQMLQGAPNVYGSYWLVTTRDGTKYRFGYDSSSELTSNTGRGYALRWSLDRVEDVHGNRIFYSYLEDPNPEDNGTSYLSSIEYNTEKARKVVFEYESAPRPDARATYESGNLVTESRRLVGISVYAADALVRRYAIDYAALDSQSSLTSVSAIRYFGSDGTSLLGTTSFEYYPSAPGYTLQSSQWVSPTSFAFEDNDYGVRYVDLNRDGFVDVVEARQKTGESAVWINDGHGGWINGTGTWKLPTWLSVYDPAKSKSYYYYNQYIEVPPGDHAGLIELHCPSMYDGGTVDYCDAIEYNQYGNVITLATVEDGQDWYHCYPGDSTHNLYSLCCNGTTMYSPSSGLAFDCCYGTLTYNDVGYPMCNGVTNHLFPHTSGAWNIWKWFYTAAYKMVDIDNGVRFVDVNNDGLPDMLQAINGLSKAWLNTGSGWTDATAQWAPPVDFFSDYKDQGVQLADVNGDGRVDVLQSMTDDKGVTTKRAWLNTGSGWRYDNAVWVAPAPFVAAGKDTGTRLEDVNGDGLPDIIQSNATSTGAWLNTGAGWAAAPAWNPPSASRFITDQGKDGGVRFADVNGDGLVDMLEDYANGTTTDRGAWINNGHGWTQDASWQSPEPFTKDGKNIGRRLADVNGDGQADISVAHTNSTGTYIWTWVRDQQTPFMLSKVTNMLGGTTSVGYAPSTQYDNQGGDGLSDLGFNIWTVANATSDNSAPGDFHVSSRTTYAYADGLYDYQGFEFRGFGRVQEALPDSSKAAHYFYQDAERKGIEYRTELSNGTGAMYSKSESEFSVTKETSLPIQPTPALIEYSADQIVCGDLTGYSNVTCDPGVKLTICPYDGTPGTGYWKVTAKYVNIYCDISGSESGYAGGWGMGVAGSGPGAGQGTSSKHIGGSGGGYGNTTRGQSAQNGYSLDADCTNNGGISYGTPDSKDDISMGSGGGAGCGPTINGGSGGGMLVIDTGPSGYLKVAGKIELRGGSGSNGEGAWNPSMCGGQGGYSSSAGAGSGGGVLLLSHTIDMAGGYVNVSGGKGGYGGALYPTDHSKGSGGSGAGGRIKIIYDSLLSNDTAYDARGGPMSFVPGCAYSAGGNGTVYFGQTDSIWSDSSLVPFENGVSEVLLSSSTSYLFDGRADNPVATKVEYSYDHYGNVVEKRMLGDVSVAGDEKTEKYAYAINTSAWIVSKPAEYQLLGADGTKAKGMSYAYDGLAFGGGVAKGDLTQTNAWLDTAADESQYPVTSYAYDSYGNMISSTDPLGRTTVSSYGARDTTYTYPDSATNALGQVTESAYDFGTGNLLWTKFSGVNRTYSYDVFGRVVKEVVPPSTEAAPMTMYSYAFDGTVPESTKVSVILPDGRPLEMYYFYDGFGTLLQTRSPADGGQQAVSNVFYDELGRAAKVQNPYFEAASQDLTAPQTAAEYAYYTSYTYDPLGRAIKVTGPDAATRNVTFDRNTIDDYDPNNHRHTYVLDGYGRIAKVIEYNDDPLQDSYSESESYETNYSYDVADNLVKIVDAAGSVYTFAYDSLGRKVSVSEPDTGIWSYTYDLTGNIISQVQHGGGSLVYGDGIYRQYNSLNQLVAIRSGSDSSSPLIENYTYDPYGKRIKIEKNDSAKTRIYTPFKDFMRIVNISGTFDYTYVYQDGAPVARVNPDGTKQFFQSDMLGSTSLVTDAAGNVIENTFYAPFGEVLSGGKSDNLMYTGQFQDSTSQYYYGSRYYSQLFGFFTQPDSIKSDIYNPQNLNGYSYTLNNPYKYTDPSGHFVQAVALAPVVVPLVLTVGTVFTLYQLYMMIQSMQITWTMPVIVPPFVSVPAATPAPVSPAAGETMPTASPTGAMDASSITKGIEKSISDALQSLPLQGSGSGEKPSKAPKETPVETKKGIFTITSYTLNRMLQRGITLDEIKSTIENNPGFEYLHEGLLKTGFWNPETGTFVATSEDVIKTVFKASLNYLYNKMYNTPG